MDAIPVFSQIKSLIQFACGQNEQAKQTQINFSRQCPVVSQVRSLVESVSGDTNAAKETQKECGLFLMNLVNGVPVLGHIKGGIHYAFGDSEGGDAALKAASHTSGVMAGGAVGFLVGGPAGAVALGIGGGAAMDATITVVDTQMKGKLQPYGFIEPLVDPTNAGKWCDAVGGIVFDGLTGHATGTLVKRVQAKGTARAAGRTAVKRVKAKGTARAAGRTAVKRVKAKGTARAAGRTAATAIPDDLVVRTVRSSAKPFTAVGLGTLIVKLKEGTIFLLKDGSLQKIQDIFSRVMNRNTTTGHFEFVTPNTDVPKTVPMFNAGDFEIRIFANVLEVYEGDKLVLFIKDSKVYIKDASGKDVEVQENHVYTQRPTGEVEEIQDQMRQNFIEDVINEHECSDTCSVIDAESVYQDSHDVIPDLEEEEQFPSSEDVLQNNGEEQQGLAFTNTHRDLARGTK